MSCIHHDMLTLSKSIMSLPDLERVCVVLSGSTFTHIHERQTTNEISKLLIQFCFIHLQTEKYVICWKYNTTINVFGAEQTITVTCNPLYINTYFSILKSQWHDVFNRQIGVWDERTRWWCSSHNKIIVFYLSMS